MSLDDALNFGVCVGFATEQAAIWKLFLGSNADLSPCQASRFEHHKNRWIAPPILLESRWFRRHRSGCGSGEWSRDLIDRRKSNDQRNPCTLNMHNVSAARPETLFPKFLQQIIVLYCLSDARARPRTHQPCYLIASSQTCDQTGNLHVLRLEQRRTFFACDTGSQLGVLSCGEQTRRCHFLLYYQESDSHAELGMFIGSPFRVYIVLPSIHLGT
ncbi:hypothetical protein BKA81DRAFT_150259 [Phyllosticta paracitricarpa]